jgi:hypothetical protein
LSSKLLILAKYSFILGILIIQHTPGFAQGKYEVAGVSDDKIVTEFLASLQAKVASDDRASIASLVDYPLTVVIAGKKHILRNPKDFISKYSLVLNQRVRNAILKTTEPFAKCDGIMLGDHGEVWLNLSAPATLKIVAINPH